MAGPSPTDPEGVLETENQVAADAAPAGEGGAPPNRSSARLAARRGADSSPPSPPHVATAPAGASGSGATLGEVDASAPERAGADKGKEAEIQEFPIRAPAATAGGAGASGPSIQGVDLETLAQRLELLESLQAQVASLPTPAAASPDNSALVLEVLQAGQEEARKQAAAHAAILERLAVVLEQQAANQAAPEKVVEPVKYLPLDKNTTQYTHAEPSCFRETVEGYGCAPALVNVGTSVLGNKILSLGKGVVQDYTTLYSTGLYLSEVARVLRALLTEVEELYLQGEEDARSHPLYDTLERCTNTLVGALSLVEKRISLVNARAVVGTNDPRLIEHLTHRVNAASVTAGLLPDQEFSEWAKEFDTKRDAGTINALAKSAGQARARGGGTGRNQNGNKKTGKGAGAKKATDQAKAQDKGKGKADQSE